MLNVIRRTSPFFISASTKEYTDKHLGVKKLLGAEEEDDRVDEEYNKIISAKEELLAGLEVLGRPGAAASCVQALGYPGASAVHVRTGRSWERRRHGWLIIFRLASTATRTQDPVVGISNRDNNINVGGSWPIDGADLR